MTREEAKKIIFNQWQSFLEHNIDYGGISEAYKMAIQALEQQPRQGNWIDRQLQNKIDGEIRKAGECSKCHSIYFRYDLSQNVVDHIPNYCPNCGARMESDKE